MKATSKLLVAVAAIMLAAQPALFAQRGGPSRDGDKRGQHEMRGPGGPLFGDPVRMQKELGLTDEQVKQIAEINREYQKKMLDEKETLAPKHVRLRKLLIEDKVDLGKVRALLKEIGEHRVELHMLRIQHRLAIESKLTDEQKAKVRQHHRKMMKNGRRGHKGGPM
ncbi:MAG: Spy/CpxP family protein refolding chaperone [Spirochaetes bacterium]|nr:Spy/CpxP family protein refolding chaperone [Spirochaetota bacterium]